jgi:hypothetical protein
MMLGVYNLFIPDPGVGVGYFLVWLAVFFLGATMITYPIEPGARNCHRTTINVAGSPQLEKSTCSLA